jgi:hypothetical protein
MRIVNEVWTNAADALFIGDDGAGRRQAFSIACFSLAGSVPYSWKAIEPLVQCLSTLLGKFRASTR